MKQNQNIWADRRTNRTEGNIPAKQGSKSPSRGIARHSMAEVMQNNEQEQPYYTQRDPAMFPRSMLKKNSLPMQTSKISKDAIAALQDKSHINAINLGQAVQYVNRSRSNIKQDMQEGKILMQGPGISSLETPRHSESIEDNSLQATPKISPRCTVQSRPSVQQKSELNSKLIKNIMHYKQDSFAYQRTKRPVQTESSLPRQREEDKEPIMTQPRSRYGSYYNDQQADLRAGKLTPWELAHRRKSSENAPLTTNSYRHHPDHKPPFSRVSHPAIHHLTVQHSKMPQTTIHYPITQLPATNEQPQQQSSRYDSLIQGLFGFVNVAKKYITGGDDSMIATQNDTSLNQTLGSSFQATSRDQDSKVPAERSDKKDRRLQETSSLNRLLNQNERLRIGRLPSEEDQPNNFIISSPQDQGQVEVDNNNSHLSMPANAQNSYDSKANRFKTINQQHTYINQLTQSADPLGAHPKQLFDTSETPVPFLTSLQNVTEENGDPCEARSDTTSPRQLIRGGLTQDVIATIIEQSSVCEDSVSTINNQAEENMGIIESFYDCATSGQNKMTPLRSSINTQFARNKKIIISSLNVDESGSFRCSNPVRNGLIRHDAQDVTSAHSDLADGSPQTIQLPLFLNNRKAQAAESQGRPQASQTEQECNQSRFLLTGELNVTNDLKQAFNEIFPSPLAQEQQHLTPKVIELPRKTSKFDHNDPSPTEEAKAFSASFNNNSLRSHRSGHIFQNRAGTQKEQSMQSKKSSQGSSQTRKVQHIWKQRDKSQKSNADNPRNTYIQQQIEPIETTFLSEAEEINRLLEGNPQPEQIAKKLVEEKNKTQIFSELQRLDILARTLVEHEGFLLKFPSGKNCRKKTPRRFWCHIRDKKLKFYKDGPQKQQLSGTIDFDLHQCRPTIEDPQYSSQVLTTPSQSVTEEMEDSGPTRFRIEMQGGCDTVFVFDAQTYHDLQLWQKALFQNWAAGEAMTRQRPIELGDKFWKMCMVSLDMVNRCADSGDLLLFAGNSMISSVSRTLQSSDYDHVAMFLRFANGNLVYFESTSDYGVQLYSWDYFIFANIQRYFKTVSFRKLRVERSQEMVENLFEFVKKTRGMDYRLDFDKLIQKTCKDDLQSTDKKKTFFCSELVAGCLKHMGIISQDKAANKFWPGCFAQNSAQLNGLLQRGCNASFEDVQTIIWPKKK